jgi:hypothetical protein
MAQVGSEDAGARRRYLGPGVLGQNAPAELGTSQVLSVESPSSPTPADDLAPRTQDQVR